ncbi:hypothetical protein FACS189490_02250 [Clostridia bacterium]|nr:hypothetical protein FACS189490_02250 [Clostridia bacterium]
MIYYAEELQPQFDSITVTILRFSLHNKTAAIITITGGRLILIVTPLVRRVVICEFYATHADTRVTLTKDFSSRKN